MDKTSVPTTEGKQMSSPGKGMKQGKKRFQLLEPSQKNELLKIFEGLTQLDGNTGTGKSADLEDDSSNSFSLELNLPGESSSDDEAENLPKDDTNNDAPMGSTVPVPSKKGLFCGSCNVKFTDSIEQRLHYTLDWHRYNVKRKIHGQAPVGEGKFDDILDDLSSIEGSDEETEERGGDNQQQLNRLMNKLTTTTATTAITIDPSQLRQNKIEKSPKLLFKNSKGEIVTCYKSILLRNENDRSRQEDSNLSDLSPDLTLIDALKCPLKLAIIMASGGHFAAAIFHGNSCTHHKTFHSYTVRAKQGGSQGGRDSKSGTSHPKSAGASLRRYNEQSFSQHVQDLLDSWKSHLNTSDFIFFRAVSSNANVLFGGKNPPLNKDSASLKTIPFPTKRPTFSEVKRVHSLLTTIHLYESWDAYHDTHYKKSKAKSGKSKAVKAKKTVDRAKSRSPKRRDSLDLKYADDTLNSDGNENPQAELELVDTVVDFNVLKEYDDSINEQKQDERSRKKKTKKAKPETQFKLEGAIAELSDTLLKGDLDGFKFSMQRFVESKEDIGKPVNAEGLTLLHTAAKQNLQDVVWQLLEAGCDPAIKDKSGKCAYNYAELRECRDTFRRFMGQFPEKYDYKKAQVPPPLSEEMEKEKAEKKKLLNKLKREKEKQKKMEKYEKDKETEEQRRFLNLSEREKRAFAAEQRILAQCKRNAEKTPVLIRCFECATDITGKVPFEYNQNIFCTTKCLQTHRKKFPCPLSV